MYLLDTPGVLPPKIESVETGMKLALCGERKLPHLFSSHCVATSASCVCIIFCRNDTGSLSGWRHNCGLFTLLFEQAEEFQVFFSFTFYIVNVYKITHFDTFMFVGSFAVMWRNMSFKNPVMTSSSSWNGLLWNWGRLSGSRLSPEWVSRGESSIFTKISWKCHSCHLLMY